MAGVPGAVREEGVGWGGGRQTLRQRTPVPVSLTGLLVLSGLSDDHEGSFCWTDRSHGSRLYMFGIVLIGVPV